MINLREKPFNLSEEEIVWVNETKKSMSLEEKVGQLFVMSNITAVKELNSRLLSIKPGGVHVGFLSPEATKENQQELINDLQNGSNIPLLITGDLESGGSGGSTDGTNFGALMQVGAMNDAEAALKFGQFTEAEGCAMGFNWAFGPVIDLNYNFENPIVNTRSLGDRPELVERMSLQIIKGIQQNNSMAACIKHWPGDGMDNRDQHKLTTKNSMNMQEWRNTYGKLYKSAIDAGVKTVMSAHISLPAYMEELGITDIKRKYAPGSLSSELNIKLLREELGFQGVIVSDATGMVGMDSYCSRKDLVPGCIASGVDMFLFTNDLEYDYNSMLEGVANGTITSERLEEAVTRILGLKASLKLNTMKKEGTLLKKPVELDVVGCQEHLDFAFEIAKRSVTLVKDTQNLLPINPRKYKKVLLISIGSDGFIFSEAGTYDGKDVEELLVKEGFEVKEYKDNLVTVSIQGNVMPLIHTLNNYEITNLDVKTQSLEELFMHYYGGKKNV